MADEKIISAEVFSVDPATSSFPVEEARDSVEAKAAAEQGVAENVAADDGDDRTGETIALSSLAIAAAAPPNENPPPQVAAAFAFDFNARANPPPVRGNVVPRNRNRNPRAEDSDDEDDDDEDDEDYDPAAMNNEFLSLLPPCVLPRIDKLKILNAKRDEIMEEYRMERAALENRYSERMEPLYNERRGVVNGEFDDAINEALKPKEGEEKFSVTGVEEAVPPHLQEGQVKGIPQFWACAMGHVDVIAELLTEADVDCLEHLTDVTCTDFSDGLGFELNFHFASNDFFSNMVLTKRYDVPNLLTEDEPILKNITGTEILWKAGRSLTYREVTKKQRKKGGKAAGQVRSVSKLERTESFFHFFTPVKMPALSDVVDEDEADAIEEAFDHDYDVAQAFRSHLIRKAVLWFTGDAMMEDYDEEGMVGDEDGEEEGNEEEGLINRESSPVDADGQPVHFKFSGGDNNPPAAGDGENPECKQS